MEWGRVLEMVVMRSPRTVAVMVICVLTVARGGGVWGKTKKEKSTKNEEGEGNSTKAPKWPEELRDIVARGGYLGSWMSPKGTLIDRSMPIEERDADAPMGEDAEFECMAANREIHPDAQIRIGIHYLPARKDCEIRADKATSSRSTLLRTSLAIAQFLAPVS